MLKSSAFSGVLPHHREVHAAVRCATAVISRKGMFIAAIVGSIAYVALSIMRFISLKVIELRAPRGGNGP